VFLVSPLTVLSIAKVTLVSVIDLWNMSPEHRWNGGGKNRSSGRKPGPSASLSTPVPIEMEWDRNRTFWMTYPRLNAWAMTLPEILPNETWHYRPYTTRT
jgi:hypothetical protein